MENLDSEYPTSEQIKETLDAYNKGGDALLELIRKRNAEYAERERRDAAAASEPTDS